MAEEKDKDRVADRLRGLCSRREYCRADMMKKALDALDGDSAAAEEVVERLVGEKYIDDLRYASAFARDKSAIAGWGTVKIKYMLSGKGIPREVVAMALDEIDGGRAACKLQKTLEVKAKSLKGDPQIRIKLLRFALGRGYDYDEVSKVVDKVIGNESI